MNAHFDALLQHPALWRAAGSRHSKVATVATGFAALNEKLPGQGWPARGIVELLVEQHGSGELDVVLPALAKLSVADEAGAGWIAWIDPPYEPYAPALAMHGLDIDRMLIAHAAEPLWAIEQALRSACCRVVMGWVEQADIKALRKLQLATEQGGCLCLLFRPVRFARQTSPASVRMILRPIPEGVQLELIRIRGGRPASVRIHLDDRKDDRSHSGNTHSILHDA